MLTRNTEANNRVTLCEEEIFDVSLATFYVFDKENAGTFRRGVRLAAGGGCGCGCGGLLRVAQVAAGLCDWGLPIPETSTLGTNINPPH